jgi:hypothetical protein
MARIPQDRVGSHPAGTAETVSLDEDHGSRISIRGHPGSWPVSTIKFAQK